MNNATRLTKREKPKAASPQDRPTRKNLMALELVLVTFNAGNTLKAIAELSDKPEAARFISDLPKGKYADRLEVCGHYKEFLASFVSEWGVIVALQSLLTVCNNRVHLNLQREQTKGFVSSWLATKKVIHMAIETIEFETTGAGICAG